MSAFVKIKKQINRPPALDFETLEDSPKVAHVRVFQGEEENQNF